MWSGFATLYLVFFPLTSATAEDMPALLEARGCRACHALQDTYIGPSYQSIARLHGERKAEMIEILAHKIIHGGAGNWGLVPMVPSEHVSEDEARRMAAWILERPID